MPILFIGYGVAENFRRFSGRVLQAVEQSLYLDATAAMEDFRKTTATWDHDVEFSIIHSPYQLGWTVATEDEIYGWVNKGTPKHGIDPHIGFKGGGKKRVAFQRTLFFQSIYIPKTFPRVIFSEKSYSMGPFVLAKHVNHPGITPREFDTTIYQKYRPIVFQHIRELLANPALMRGG